MTVGNDDRKPQIFVWCNSCSDGWHQMAAIAEDGEPLAGHICSHHGYAAHDMGIHPDGWKRDKYAAKYPGGFDVVWIEDFDNGGEAFRLALERNTARQREAEAEVSP